MGMAASQARWISLAARKTNVEYEGQQINQARTALANKSSELWNQLYNMQVPTAPNTTDYTKTQYSFKSGGTTKTIENIDNVSYIDPDTGMAYNSYVTYSSEVSEYTGVQKSNYNPQVHVVSGNYMVGTKTLTQLSTCVPSAEKTDENWATYVAALNQIKTDLPNTEIASQWNAYLATVTEENPYGDASLLSGIYLWLDSSNEYNFSTKAGNNGLDACIANPDRTLFSYYADNQIHNKKVSDYAYIEYDSSGRATSMQLRDSTAVYDLTTETVTDNVAYNDAMNKYNYNKQVYEKKVQDINARTEQIQTEDRTLELRLKALDTEQNALSTEMEAVKKVISKNIQDTFKTFDSN